MSTEMNYFCMKMHILGVIDKKAVMKLCIMERRQAFGTIAIACEYSSL